ncbi:hypothetical protein P8631_23140, partial [Guyparkeria sp. 1SP6A2]|nr:hypothetical protein [Guyparkeria sp. 1SP6A2]
RSSYSLSANPEELIFSGLKIKSPVARPGFFFDLISTAKENPVSRTHRVLFDEPEFDQLLASTPTFRSWISFVGSSEAVA